MMQSPTVEHVQERVKVCKANLTPVGPPSILKIVEEGQPPQGNYLPSIGEEVRPQYVKLECPNHPGIIPRHHPWKRLVI